jgi:(p)ppGpp synthase/HD superfamily hydrolase
MNGIRDKSTSKFADALRYGARVHAGQVCKGSGVPYVSHLMAVCSIVIEYGGNETEAIAAFLHDVIEDCGGHRAYIELRECFGANVADIVMGCTDSWANPKPLWKERKIKYLHQLEIASRSILLVACADKLHNARSMLKDYQMLGEMLWSHLMVTPQETIWYYQCLVDIFHERKAELPALLVKELVDTVASLQQKIGSV